MNKNKHYTLNIDMLLAEDMSACTCTCKYATSAESKAILAALLASAVVAIAHDSSRDPHAFAKAVTCTVMEFIDKPGFTKPKEQLS